jgi:hypothetical protein
MNSRMIELCALYRKGLAGQQTNQAAVYEYHMRLRQQTFIIGENIGHRTGVHASGYTFNPGSDDGYVLL